MQPVADWFRPPLDWWLVLLPEDRGELLQGNTSSCMLPCMLLGSVNHIDI